MAIVTVEYHVSFRGTCAHFHKALVNELVTKHTMTIRKETFNVDITELSLSSNEYAWLKVILYESYEMGYHRVKLVMRRLYLEDLKGILASIEAYLRDCTDSLVRVRNFVCPKCHADKPWSSVLENNIQKLGSSAVTACDCCDERFLLLENVKPM